VITIPVPPLRDRVEDIIPLATAFLAAERKRQKTRAQGFSDAARQILESHTWPGNVRELQSAIERATLRHDGEGPLDASSLPKSLLTAEAVVRSFRSEQPTLKDLERVYIQWVLENSAGTKADAARRLGISRKSLWEKCKRFGIA
jgi:transcriptional regulator with PAS, ATPase and Fis domain